MSELDFLLLFFFADVLLLLLAVFWRYAVDLAGLHRDVAEPAPPRRRNGNIPPRRDPPPLITGAIHEDF